MGEVGFHCRWCAWRGMASTHIFGMRGGYGRLLFVSGLVAYLTYLSISRTRSLLCLILVGMREERCGVGGGVCGRGRRSFWRSVRFYFPLLFCSLIFQISGSGSPILKGGYLVRTGCQLLSSQDVIQEDTLDNLIWHTQVPLKVTILAWRFLHDRLPTKSNLVNRGIITPKASLCTTACGQTETTSHMFLHCATFGSLWQIVRSWLGVTGVDPHNIRDHFVQFTYCLGGVKKRRSFLQLLWLVCVWVI